MEKILLAQLIAHIVGDFFAQPECISQEKQNNTLKSWHIYIHALIVFVAALGLTFAYSFIYYALAIAIIHLGIDILKCTIERRLKERKKIRDFLYTNHYLFFTDQILHLIVIYIAVAMYCNKNEYIPLYLDVFNTRQLLTVVGLLLCMKPANVFVRSCLASLNLYDEPKNDKSDLERADGGSEVLNA